MRNKKLKMPSSAYTKVAPFSQREKEIIRKTGRTLSLWERGVRLAQAGEGFLLVLCILSFVITAQAVAVPIISNVELTSLSDDSMVITWTTTNDGSGSSTEILWGSGGLTNIATGAASTSTTVMSGTTKYHYVELKGLYQNTTYQYRIKSGDTVFPPSPWFSPSTFKTLEKPGGEYLFSFAVLNDLRYAEKTETPGSRGIPYSQRAAILDDEVSNINNFTDPNGAKGVAFTVINGNIADNSVNYGAGTELTTNLKGKLDQLTGATFPPGIAYKYLPVPGYQDKKAAYATDWITNSFKPLTSNTSIESVYGYNANSKEVNSVFNYQFEYNNYNFIFLDSVNKPTANATGEANLSFLKDKISSSLKKTFIFMSYPAYNPLDASTKDYPVAIPTGEVGGDLCISNHADFRATLESFMDSSQNPSPIVAAVISSHLGDNYKRDIPLSSDPTKSISYVRQGPALQYPTGYSIYKVYSTGYVKTFYKTKGRDGTDKPYYEYARDCISGEVVSGQTLLKDVLTQFWLGSSSNRNFTFQYAFIPGVSPKVITNCPSSNESAVSLNIPILITFNKRMSTPSTDWVTIKDNDNNSVAVTSASFTDSNQLTLKITHADFTIDKTYTVTVIASKAMDEGSTKMSASYPDYTFSFNTNGGTKDDAAPTATINPLPDNSTTDPFPILTGVATDSSRVITVEYRFDNTGSWASTEAVLGEFTGTTEVFQIKPSTALSAGSHQVWLKTSDGIGNTSAEGFRAYSFDLVVGDRPTTSSFKVNGNNAYPGDPISSTPKIEIKITSINPLASGRITIGSITSALTFVKVDTNYYATYEGDSVLPDGSYVAIVEAFDTLGNATTYEVSSLYVKSAGDATVQGTPLSYPNPFDPGVSTAEIISYTLSKAANIVLSIHDLSGTMIVRKTYSSSENGGLAGYNAIPWNGKSDAGDYVGNGIYVFLIVADGKVVSRGKLTVLKR